MANAARLAISKLLSPAYWPLCDERPPSGRGRGLRNVGRDQCCAIIGTSPRKQVVSACQLILVIDACALHERYMPECEHSGSRTKLRGRHFRVRETSLAAHELDGDYSFVFILKPEPRGQQSERTRVGSSIRFDNHLARLPIRH